MAATKRFIGGGGKALGGLLSGGLTAALGPIGAVLGGVASLASQGSPSRPPEVLKPSAAPSIPGASVQALPSAAQLLPISATSVPQAPPPQSAQDLQALLQIFGGSQ